MSSRRVSSSDDEVSPDLGRFGWFGLSSKLLALTMIFVMLTEILIFVPSVSNYRLTWLSRYFVTAEASSLALRHLPPGDSGDSEDPLRHQLLDLLEAELIVVRDEGVSRILASRSFDYSVATETRVTEPGRLAALGSVTDAFDTLLFGGDRLLRIYGPTDDGGILEIVAKEGPLRDAMLGYARNVMAIAFLLSASTAILIFFCLRWLMVRPLQHLSRRMVRFARSPQESDNGASDESSAPAPSRRDEIGFVTEQFGLMRDQIRETLNHRRRLADLGLAVSKINHDLRNILASASLFSDRLSNLSDPAVQHIAPRLVKALDRAVEYTRLVLSYGETGLRTPKKTLTRLYYLVEDVAQILALDLEGNIEWRNSVPRSLTLEVDGDQMFRVILNLCRNSVQAMTRIDRSTINRLTVEARHDKVTDCVVIVVSDTGPGLSSESREDLFAAFGGSGVSSGLGLAIAAEIVEAHGGTIELLSDRGHGAHFQITLPLSAE